MERFLGLTRYRSGNLTFINIRYIQEFYKGSNFTDLKIKDEGIIAIVETPAVIFTLLRELRNYNAQWMSVAKLHEKKGIDADIKELKSEFIKEQIL